jgi:hypothetical protein
MVTNTTRYSPDTCDCVIEYSWDSTLSEDQRVHTLSTISKCSFHSGLSDNTAYNTVFEENPRKNIAYQLILDNGPVGLSDLVDGTRQIKPGIFINTVWSGTAPNRVLTVTVTGFSLTQNQKNSIQTFLNNRFGAGKVLIA